MVSTVERGSFFAFTRCANNDSSTGCGNGVSPPFIDDDDLLLPSRSTSFKSVGSSASYRRAGVVGERQLDSLQRRLVNHVQPSPPSPSTPNGTCQRVVPDVSSPPSRASTSSNGSHRGCNFDSAFQLYRSAPLPLPPRRSLVSDQNRAVVQQQSLSPSLTSTAAAAATASAGPLRASLTPRHHTTGELDRRPASIVGLTGLTASSPYVTHRPSNYSPNNRQEYSEVKPRQYASIGHRPPLDGGSASTADRQRSFSIPTSTGTGSVTGLESRLAEREAELRTLRETMERNEWAILKALDDQRRRSDSEAAERSVEWKRRLDEMCSRAALEQRSLNDAIGRLTLQNCELRSALNAANDRLERYQQQSALRRADHSVDDSICLDSPARLRSSFVATETPVDAPSSEGGSRHQRQANRRGSSSFDNDARSAASVQSSTGGQSIYALLSECFAGTLKKSSTNSNNGLDVTTFNNAEDARSPSSVGSVFIESLDDRNTIKSASISGVLIEPNFQRNGICRLTPPETAPSTTGSSIRSVTETGGDDIDVERCRCCDEMRVRLEQRFEREKDRWLSEKQRVVEYQKLLQVGYVQLVKRCQELEEQLRQFQTSQCKPTLVDLVVGTAESRSSPTTTGTMMASTSATNRVLEESDC